MQTKSHPVANTYISQLTPYQPGKPIEEVERELGIVSAIKLASNENPLGASINVKKAISHALDKIPIYPDGSCYQLKHSLANFLNVLPAQLTIGNGSENILELITKAYLSPNDAAIISEYAFLTIPLLIKSHGGKAIVTPAIQFKHDISKMVASVNNKTRIIFIVNPNNPTGTYTTTAELTYLLNSVPEDVLIVVDEAYNEYISKEDYPDTLALLARYPNLIITRTFSKAYGLAGLRLGFSISSPEIADMLNRARLPFNVNVLAEVAGCAALADQDHIKKSILMNNLGMQQMIEGLKKLSVDYIPSLGNFVTMNVKQNAQTVYQKLLYEGIIVRPLAAYDMPNYVRVTIGEEKQNEQFLRALQKVL